MRLPILVLLPALALAGCASDMSGDGTDPVAARRALEIEQLRQNAACRRNLHAIGLLLDRYREKAGKLPKRLTELKSQDPAPPEALFSCADPAGGRPFRYASPRDGKEALPDSILAYDTDPHADGRRSLLTLRGDTYTVRETEFQRGRRFGTLSQLLPNLVDLQVSVTDSGNDWEIRGIATVSDLRLTIPRSAGKWRAGARLSVQLKEGVEPVASEWQTREEVSVNGKGTFELSLRVPKSDCGAIAGVMMDVRDETMDVTVSGFKDVPLAGPK